ncbi:MAG: hypothetical protein LBD24_06990 [Spirochaetaceae bacterium]|nr:hypothetical protein [Spirochaetaceae bacterium]
MTGRRVAEAGSCAVSGAAWRESGGCVGKAGRRSAEAGRRGAEAGRRGAEAGGCVPVSGLRVL